MHSARRGYRSIPEVIRAHHLKKNRPATVLSSAANRPEELKYAYRTIRFRPLVGCLKQLDMVGQLLRLRSE